MSTCNQCGAPTILDADVGLVCTGCAELVNPARVVLTCDIDYQPSTTSDGWMSVARKAIKTGRNRYLSGQGKEVRDSKNLEDMHWFIKNLARAAFVSAMTDRAYNLFQQAMATGEYRWGRTAKLVAGACICISLRLNNRPETFPDVAVLLGEKPTLLTRTFSSVVSALKIDKLPSSEPKSHIATLQAHLSAAFEDSNSGLPSSLITAIKPLPANAILATAMSLSELLVSSTPPSAVARLPTSPTACAVLIWAIEAEARTSLTPLGDISAFLGSKCNATRPVIMSRYKAIQDELIERIDKIDWLDHYEPGSGKSGRAKISRRLVAARGLKAVIECERECRFEEFKTDPNEEAGSDSDDTQSAERRPRKRRRAHALQEATRFLLNPLLGPLPSSFFPSAPNSLPLPLPTYLLTSSLSMRCDKLPSRLQLLSAARGGVSHDEINDDELFDDGELERIMRTETEVVELRNILGWEHDEVQEELPKEPLKRRKRAERGVKPMTSSRLNAEAIAHFFADDKPDEEFGGLLLLDDPNFVTAEDRDDTDAFIGLRRTLMASAAEQGDKEEPYFPSSSPEPEDRYAQEL
ncbi:hypothetical protein GGX14DRAFT_590252 [Mycena pura]|uniref:B-related factor 1 n=1 Tax=Mycena pura TaxID=153505 RepID=A0AAD6VSV6_9AGAR|nr:hypothetical protein GGX14DRAFT_590252 [Mycena pura]